MNFAKRMVTRAAIVSAARAWVGTPYHHQASVQGVGCDCLGLIRGVWRTLYGPELEAMPPYTRDWGNATGSETLLKAASRHLIRLTEVSDAGPGDVLVFRMRDRGVAKHAGILVSRTSYRRKPVSSATGSAPASLDSGFRRNDGSTSAQAAQRAVAQTKMHLVHAQEGLGVVEIELGAWWRRRAVAAFRFPGVV